MKTNKAIIGDLEGGQLIDVDKWALAELNVPFYPETRVFKKLSRTFCDFGIVNEKLIFLENVKFKRKIKFLFIYVQRLNDLVNANHNQIGRINLF